MHQIIVEEFSVSPFSSLSEWFSQVQHHKGASLLHSGNSDHENAKHHIASALPLISVELLINGKIDVSFPNLDDFIDVNLVGEIKEHIKQLVAKRSNPENFCSLLEQIQHFLFPMPTTTYDFKDSNGTQNTEESNFLEEQSPFKVGCIGYASYDYGRFLEELPKHTENSYQTAVFTANFYSWSLVANIATQEVWLNHSSRFKKPDLDKITAPDSNVTQEATQEFSLTSDWHSNMSQKEYKKKFDRIKEYLLSGDCYQVNLAQRFHAQYEGNEWQAWQVLLHQNQAPFSAFLRLHNSCILSCSPERFLSVNQGLIETKPIKGTRPRFTDPELDERSRQALFASEKDRAENLMIVDLLRNDISKNSQPHSVVVKDLFAIETFSAVHHLVSTIEGKMDENSTPLKVFSDAFPGGSITGAPKIRAMEVIDELEPHRRNIYCGSIFYLDSNGHFDSNICIRTLLFEDNKVFCWAGGGIVADSDPQLEYQETFHKVEKILPTLRHFRRQV